ncbi:uncharacterized protein EAE97_004368 [Botrytis byssoidea]|uniref:Uncharacterized protein n=1 Tax=Botrytis byssoidea TaxID=139641 RepID=A0A9P5M7K9_9HELO|nr:uncharacterized protein EAE97_004368 [Botrytis byssoidea]KAF7947119.1 hypothetical protein EAE97_004368 [Botrytis byssoidea]
MVRLNLCIDSSRYNVYHYAYSNPISSEQSTTSQPAIIQKIESRSLKHKSQISGRPVADQEKRLEEMKKSNLKKAIEDLTKRIEELESWPGISEDAPMEFLQDSSNDAEGNLQQRGRLIRQEKLNLRRKADWFLQLPIITKAEEGYERTCQIVSSPHVFR